MTISSTSSLSEILTAGYTAPETTTTDEWTTLEIPTTMATNMALIGTWSVNIGAFSNDLTTFFTNCALDLNYCALEYYENNFDGLALGVDNNWTEDSSLTGTLY